MSLHHGLRRLWREGGAVNVLTRRALYHDGRSRLSNFWTPTQPRKHTLSGESAEDGHDLLQRAGFLRQAHSGIFHLLPLGLRVQDKLERLIDKHMQRLGASKVSLSSISSQELWRKSGRLEGRDSELFQLQDRKDAKYLLSPTHEEEITSVVKTSVHSHRDLPLRLYQVTRKYRDEARPRQGLLRGREFIMKDLYTFDLTEERAMETYEDARKAYKGFLDELNLPYLVANADSGSMGGNHSHEYHFISSKGEDTIINCNQCGLCINEELYLGKYETEEGKEEPGTTSTGPHSGNSSRENVPYQVWYGRVLDSTVAQSEGSATEPTTSIQDGKALSSRTRLLKVFLPNGAYELNPQAIKQLVPGVNTSDPVDPSMLSNNNDGQPWTSVVSVRDPRVTPLAIKTSYNSSSRSTSSTSPLESQDTIEAPFLLTKARSDDPCPKCATTGSLSFQQAVEIGHTFHLGTRYSAPFEAMVQNEQNELVELQMGCHGIGMSRLLGAVANLLADDRGLNWPVSIAPYGALLLGTGKVSDDDVVALYDRISSETALAMDAVIDDRDRPIGWKLNDADLIGYPFIIVLGRAWGQRKAVELQCRRLQVKEEVPYELLEEKLAEYSKRL